MEGLFRTVLMLDDRKEWLNFARILPTFSFKNNIVIVIRTLPGSIEDPNDYEKIVRDS